MHQPTKRGAAVWAAAIMAAAGMPLAAPTVAGAASECQVRVLARGTTPVGRRR